MCSLQAGTSHKESLSVLLIFVRVLAGNRIYYRRLQQTDSMKGLEVRSGFKKQKIKRSPETSNRWTLLPPHRLKGQRRKTCIWSPVKTSPLQKEPPVVAIPVET